jgi:DNA-directed RNA polymerase subunit beta
VIRNKVKSVKGRFFVLSEQEKNLTISFNDVKLYSSQKILLKRNNDFINKYFSDVSFSSVSSYQLFSLVSSFIPFFQHNDANRTLMGIGMQKQAVILIKREAAIVNSGVLKQFIGNGSFVSKVNSSGLVTFVSDKKIFLKSFEFLTTSTVKNEIFYNKICANLKSKTLEYNTNRLVFLPSNIPVWIQNRNMLNSHLKRKNSRVIAKETVRGDAVKNSTMLGIGKNVFLSYMSWKGYNFEDAIVINEKLINNDLFTSLHIKKYIIFLLNDRLGSV